MMNALRDSILVFCFRRVVGYLKSLFDFLRLEHQLGEEITG